MGKQRTKPSQTPAEVWQHEEHFLSYVTQVRFHPLPPQLGRNWYCHNCQILAESGSCTADSWVEAMALMFSCLKIFPIPGLERAGNWRTMAAEMYYLSLPWTVNLVDIKAVAFSIMTQARIGFLSAAALILLAAKLKLPKQTGCMYKACNNQYPIPTATIKSLKQNTLKDSLFQHEPSSVSTVSYSECKTQFSLCYIY